MKGKIMAAGVFALTVLLMVSSGAAHVDYAYTTVDYPGAYPVTY